MVTSPAACCAHGRSIYIQNIELTTSKGLCHHHTIYIYIYILHIYIYIYIYYIRECYSTFFKYYINIFLLTARHYFVLSFIGRSQGITCSFTSETVQRVEVHSNESILDSIHGKTISFEITETTDTIHNKEYVCIGVASDGNDFFVNITIVALSKL